MKFTVFYRDVEQLLTQLSKQNITCIWNSRLDYAKIALVVEFMALNQNFQVMGEYIQKPRKANRTKEHSLGKPGEALCHETRRTL